MTEEEIQLVIDAAYDSGFIDGVTTYAWWQDGTQMVGTTGNTLKNALAKREEGYNYSPPRLEEFPDAPSEK